MQSLSNALEQHFHAVMLIWLAAAVLAFAFSKFIRAPYGRHQRRGWGPQIPNHLGWVLMEMPVLLLFNLWFLRGPVEPNAVHWVFAALFNLHYVYRALIYPFRLRTAGKTMPLLIALMAVGFNLVNGSLLGFWLGNLSGAYTNAWFGDLRFAAGLLLFAGGMGLNIWADNRLIKLRAPGETRYRIPQGGAFRWISCPNHLGEMLEWGGYALLTWSAPALLFFAWTVLNVLPRSLAHHRWYKENFAEYPPGRKALIPGLL